MFAWPTLPFEIRQVILELVISHQKPKRDLGEQPDGRGTAIFATVCTEWQSFFEAKHFGMLLLTQQCLSDFKRIVQGRRRKLVNHIWLRIELTPYDCRSCRLVEDPLDGISNRVIFTDALKVLFGCLSTWNDSSDRSDRGLTLELSAYSPSDAEHFFKEYDFTHNPYSDAPGNFQATLADRTHPKFHDLNHLWESGRRVNDDQRVFPNCLRIHGLKGLCIVPPNYDDSPPFSAKKWLPEVGVVTKLLIRRQNYRLIHPDGLGQILERLKGLQDVVCETPQIPSHQAQATFDSRYCHIFRDWIPTTLKRLTLFEDFDGNFFSCLKYLLEDYATRLNNWELGLALISASKDLESLAASFIVDAEDFLYPFRPRDDLDPADQRAGIQKSWDCLETLALTSQTLSARQSRGKVNDLLHAAANAARRMPKLRVLEIWYGQGTEEGCIFRYNRNGGKIFLRAIFDSLPMWNKDCQTEICSRGLTHLIGNVTWQSTWSFEFAPRVLSSWAGTIEQHSGNCFAYCDMLKVEEMELNGTIFPASVLRSLWLKDLAVHRVSLRQLEIMGDQP